MLRSYLGLVFFQFFMFCAYTTCRPRYQVSVYRAIGPLVFIFDSIALLMTRFTKTSCGEKQQSTWNVVMLSLEPHCYLIKLRFTLRGVHLSYLTLKHRLWVLNEVVSLNDYPESMTLAKDLQIFTWKLSCVQLGANAMVAYKTGAHSENAVIHFAQILAII